ncbi:hypothetical protein SKAU_G00201580 [Synaphobranchus kaupii]|uniref:Uncharacterized protein n=1 Tax=Synaphobranchus kaupii TaxID=118154 RepID=A0A9Q1FFL2_SYNKA|nr:hypothetical protein SKAU_G00201580 [Synaphobranchus kaupii]
MEDKKFRAPPPFRAPFPLLCIAVETGSPPLLKDLSARASGPSLVALGPRRVSGYGEIGGSGSQSAESVANRGVYEKWNATAPGYLVASEPKEPGSSPLHFQARHPSMYVGGAPHSAVGVA